MASPYQVYNTNERTEHDLFTHVRKATNYKETAPKQKHVRSCILYTWDYKTSVAFWNALRMLNVYSDEVQCFKSLITIHKVLREGFPLVLKEALREKDYLESLKSFYTQNSYLGYASLIRHYVDFLYRKLAFHRTHTDFTGNMNYEEYVAVKGVTNIDEGYLTVSELMQLQDDVDSLQRAVFQSFSRMSNNECRIAALVPLVEESYGIYLFITSMLRALHCTVKSVEILAPLRERYNNQFRRLKRFYEEAEKLKYLTSLITVPKLPSEPPQLYFPEDLKEDSPVLPPLPARKKEQEPLIRVEDAKATPPFPPIQPYNDQVRQLQNELQHFRTQYQNAEDLIGQYERRLKGVDNEMNALRKAMQDQQNDNVSKINASRNNEDEINEWKTKYEKLAKMYAQLRSEYLALLKAHSECEKVAAQLTAAQKTIENLKKANASEIFDLSKERDKYKLELGQIETNHQKEIDRLRYELEQSGKKIEQLSKSKGDEVQNMVRSYNTDKANLESMKAKLEQELKLLRSKLEDRNNQVDKLQMVKDQDIAVLQSGLDQSIMQFTSLQKKLDEKDRQSNELIEKMKLEHAEQLDRILDTVLETCKHKVEDAIFALDDPSNLGNQTATAEYALSMAEKLSSSGNEFTTTFLRFIKGSGSQTDAINEANDLAASVEQLLTNAKGASRLAADDENLETIINGARAAAKAAFNYFNTVVSKKLSTIDDTRKPLIVNDCNDRLHKNVLNLVKALESLVPKDVADTTGMDFGDLVEREMMNAAKAIEDAAARLTAIMNQPKPKVAVAELSVHNSILDAAMSITQAIANLIKAATVSQREIVAQGKGSSSATQFYKKNHRWTEGLISAAKAIAIATSTLVECADGVVQGTHKMEQLVVASKEVAAATAQLVAAARVKAARGSRTQDNLENASKAIADAVKNLVKAANQIAERRQHEEVDKIDLSKLSVHEVKRKEMEQQVQILTLERQLTDARRKLADMRRSTYQTSDYQPQ